MDILKDILTHILQNENCTVSLSTRTNIATLFGDACLHVLQRIKLIIENDNLNDSERVIEIKRILLMSRRCEA